MKIDLRKSLLLLKQAIQEAEKEDVRRERLSSAWAIVETLLTGFPEVDDG